MHSPLSRTLAAGAVVLLATVGPGAAQSDLDARAQALHRRILAIDSHTDVLLPSTPDNYWAPGHTSRIDVSKLKRGGLGAIALSIAVGPGPRTPQGLADARAEADAKAAAIRAFIDGNAADVALARSADDIERIHTAGKIAIIKSFQNTRSIGTDAGAIDRLHQDGVRLFAFTHAGNNEFADSSRPSAGTGEEHQGLSPLGKAAVGTLNRLGVIIDISQLTPAGVLQVLSLTTAPVIASHSNVRALIDNPRNLSDQELDAIKANGGVVHVTPFNAYLKTGTPQPRAAVRDLVDHIDYIVKRIGIDHAGIGSDFNHGAGIDGFDDEGDAPNVTAELLRRGYTEEQIAKIWGGNFLRVFRAVEAAAQKAAG